MATEDTFGIDLDEDGTKITDLLERAERYRRVTGDDKCYVNLDELFLLASQPDLDRETRVYKSGSGDWVVEIFFSGMIFINVSPFMAFVDRNPANPAVLN